MLEGTHVSMTIKEIQAGYVTNPYFINMHLYLAQNKLPSSQVAIRQVETQAEKYLLGDSLLFRIHTYHKEQNSVLCIPESCVDYILDLYHNLLFGAHQGSLRKFINNQLKHFWTIFDALHWKLSQRE